MASATKLVNTRSAAAPSAPLLTAEDVAQITGLSTETLAQWRSQRKGIPFLKLSRNVVRYQQGDLDAWLAQHIVRVEADSSDAARRT
jgi:predicted DNA-binding transcriptional regulator AlpA